MRITNAAGPMAPTSPTAPANTEARARAIAAAVAAPAGIDQNNIAPENAALAGQNVTSEEPAVDPQVTPEAPEQQSAEPPKQDLSEQHQKLLRREKALRAQQRQQEQALRQREQELQRREQELAAKSQAPSTDLSKYVDRQQLTADPLGTLVDLGYSADQIANLLMQQQQPQDPRMTAEIRRLNQQIEKLTAAQDAAQKNFEETQNQSYQTALKQIETDVKRMVSADPMYETIKAANASRDVVELIERTWKEDGILLSNEEAAQQVEDYLVEEAFKLAQLKKVQSRLAPKVAQPTPAPAKEQKPATQKQQQPMKTLTNSQASSRKLSARERAMLAFKGELK